MLQRSSELPSEERASASLSAWGNFILPVVSLLHGMGKTDGLKLMMDRYRGQTASLSARR